MFTLTDAGTKRATRATKTWLKSTMVGVMGIAGAMLGQIANAQATYVFTKIADTNTADPSGGTFGSFDDPSISGTSVAFRGFNAAGTQIGVYLSKSGVLSKIADLKTVDPSGSKFTDFGAVSISGGTVAFTGTYSANNYAYTDQGVYTGTGGALSVLVDVKTTVPGSTKKFTDFAGSLQGSMFAFLGTSSLGSNIYGVQSGVVSLLAGSTTVDPSGGKFTTLSDVRSDANNNVIFNGYSSTTKLTGLYEKVGSTLSTIVDTTMADPSGGKFFAFGTPVFVGANVAFYGVNTNIVAKGIYEKIGTQIITIADTSTPDPLGGTFGFLSEPAGSIYGVAFIGYDVNETHPGIYTNFGGALSSVIKAGDVIDGKTVGDLALSQNGMDGYNIAFHIYFTDNSEALYLAQCTNP